MAASTAFKTSALILFTATLLPVASSAAEPMPGKPITPESDCLVANHVSAWAVVHDKRLVVKSLGGRYYDIQLTRSCPKLQQEHFLSFRNGLMPVRGSGAKYLGANERGPARICGNIGDAVRLTRGIGGTSNPCPIDSIRRIDERAFEAVLGADSYSADKMLDEAPTSRREVAAND